MGNVIYGENTEEYLYNYLVVEDLFSPEDHLFMIHRDYNFGDSAYYRYDNVRKIILVTKFFR